MKTTLYLAPFFVIASPLIGQTLYNGELAAAVTVNNGASAFNYSPGSAYGLHAYNGSNVTYLETNSSSLLTGTGTVLEMTNNGGFDGVLRYNSNHSAVANFVNNTGSGEDPFLTDLKMNPILSFDVAWNGVGTFAQIKVDVNTNAAGGGGEVYNLDLSPNAPVTVSFNLFNNSTFQNSLSAIAADSGTSFAQFRIVVNTSSTEGGTFAIDNIALSTVPEPSTTALLAGIFIFACVLARRRIKMQNL